MSWLFPVAVASDLLIWGFMATGMGLYFESPSSIFFGLYDFVIAFVIMKNESEA